MEPIHQSFRKLRQEMEEQKSREGEGRWWKGNQKRSGNFGGEPKVRLDMEMGCFVHLCLPFLPIIIWSNYSDLTRPHPKR